MDTKPGRRSAGWLAPSFVLAVATVVVAACGNPQQEGGVADTLRAAFKPRAAVVQVPPGATCPAVDPHGKHATLSCEVCHPCGGQLGFGSDFTYPGGTTTTGGTVVKGTPTTCTVACHYPFGSPSHQVAWNAGSLACTACHAVSSLPAGHPAVSASYTRADCELCHDTSQHTSGTLLLKGHGASWMDTASAGFHAYSANRGLASCQGCHGVNLDGVGSYAKTACSTCHGASWSTTCTMCHGGTANATGAPPKGIWGYATDPMRIGAHTAHATGAIATPFDCVVCHVKPDSAFSAGHLDGPYATVTFQGLAVPGNAPFPTWDRTTGTCASTYCHGAGLASGTLKNPSWTGGATQAACGTCHEVNARYIGGSHGGYSHRRAACGVCHGGTYTTSVVNRPLHVNGIKDVRGSLIRSWDPVTKSCNASCHEPDPGNPQTW